MKLTLINFLDEVIFQNALNIVKQGGNAVQGVSRVKCEFILPTVNHFIQDYLQPIFQVTTFTENTVSDKVFLFGSTGKKIDSGDIDIAIDLTKFEDDWTVDKLVKAIYIYAKKKSFDRQIVINPMTNEMIHFAYPQYDENNNQTGETVQVDLFLAAYPVFTKFITYYPGEKYTRYKSAHRNELLKAIATVISRKNLVSDKQTYEVLKWTQEDINDNGVYVETKTLIDDNGNRLKYKDTDENLISSYAKVIDSKAITHQPEVCINRYVGNYTQKEIDTFEKLYNIIVNDFKFKFANIKDDILYEAARRLTENTRLEFPEELQRYF